MGYEIDYDLLERLSVQPHPLLNIMDDWAEQIRSNPPEWTGEVLHQARNVHHLLDMAQIPHGFAYANDLDSRACLAVLELIDLRRLREAR